MAEHTVKTSNAICSTCGEKSDTMQECAHSSHGSFNKAICEKCNQPDVFGYPNCQDCANMGKCGKCERETRHDLYCPICHKDLCDQCYYDATDSCTACALIVSIQKHIQEDPSIFLSSPIDAASERMRLLGENRTIFCLSSLIDPAPKDRMRLLGK